MKKVSLPDGGYVIVDEDSDIDPESMFIDESKLKQEATKNVPKNIVILKKDNIEYSGSLKRFVLTENEHGIKTIKVVFELNE